ncbi:Clp protease N-terminal domain-containing protein [Colwellia sp. E150_009]
MFKRLKLYFKDIKTLGKLIPGAEKQANIMGEEKPGAEHFVLSALCLEDGTAKRALAKFGVDANIFKNAITAQYKEALTKIGLCDDAFDTKLEPIKSNRTILKSKPSGQYLINSLYELKKVDKSHHLQSAHVLIAAATIEYGVVTRAFEHLGIDRELLSKAAKDELLLP